MDIEAIKNQTIHALAWEGSAGVELNQQDVLALISEVELLQGKLDKVRELHTKIWSDLTPPGGYICRACLHPIEDDHCPTIQALEEE